MSRNKEHLINMVASVISLAISTITSFVLSPYIVKNIGVEANGYITLANNFITYAMLIRTALNSMGSRFIMMAFYQKDYKRANSFYSSLFFGDALLSVAFVIIGILGIWKLDSLINLSVELADDVKILFALLFLNFIQSTFVTAWCTAPYVKNKLYLDSWRQAEGALIKAAVILLCFVLLAPKMYYVGLGTLISGIFVSLFGIYYKFKLLPELKIRVSDFSWDVIKKLVSSGLWNSISSLSSILLNDLDLIVTNLLIDPLAMGVLSVAKTMPGFVSTLNARLADIFVPSLIIDYAANNLAQIKKTIFRSAKIISVICTIPLGFLIVYGDSFYRLWQPTQNAQLLQILSIITIGGRVFFTGMQPLYSVFTVTNKVRQNSIVMVFNGVVSFVITIVLVKFTSLGVFAVAGVSVVCSLIRNLVFVIPFSAKYLGLKWHAFYLTVWSSVSCTMILCVIGYGLKCVIPSGSWLMLFVSGGVFSIIGLAATSAIVLSREERGNLLKLLLKKVKR